MLHCRYWNILNEIRRNQWNVLSFLFLFFKELIEPPNFNLDKNKAQEKRSEIAHKQGNIWSRTYMLQLFCNSETDKLDGAFWVAAWYFWAAAPSWLTWEAKITTIKYTQYPIVAFNNQHFDTNIGRQYLIKGSFEHFMESNWVTEHVRYML